MTSQSTRGREQGHKKVGSYTTAGNKTVVSGCRLGRKTKGLNESTPQGRSDVDAQEFTLLTVTCRANTRVYVVTMVLLAKAEREPTD